MNLHDWITNASLVSLCAVAAITDLRRGLIPNTLTFPAMALGVTIGAFSGGVDGAASALCGALACGLVPLLLFRWGGLGGGDVKLFCAVGALVGAIPSMEIQICAFSIGAVYGVGLWIRRGKLLDGVRRMWGMLLWASGRRKPAKDRCDDYCTSIKFAPCVLLGALAVIIRDGIGAYGVGPW